MPRSQSRLSTKILKKSKLFILAAIVFAIMPIAFNNIDSNGDRLFLTHANPAKSASLITSTVAANPGQNLSPSRLSGHDNNAPNSAKRLIDLGNNAIAAEIAPSLERSQGAIDPRLERAFEYRQTIVGLMLAEANQRRFDPCGEGTSCYGIIKQYAEKIDSTDRFIAELNPTYSPWRDGLDGMVDPRVDRNGTLTTYADNIERQLLYEFLVAQRLAQSVAQSEQLEAILTMGGPGSGKSTVLRQLDLCQAGTIINADDFKADFAEYQAGLAAKDRLTASRVHEESSLLARRTRNESIQTQRSFCWDGTLSDREEALKLISILQSRGYHVTVIGAMLPAQIGVERVINRGERTGRFIPLEVVTDSYEKIAQHAEQVVIAADRGYLYDTNVEFGKEPPLVARYEKGEPQFRNADFLARLKAGQL
ncbi:Zeta toxin family protein [Thalassoporum mexicanum PCC 7367]|uniref:zeta toxin family protein n=1 Tax=Thalassoporum mexicanum TaxID=3457544 RepID=UPI00029FF027|nr:zeta toxin family protein [Pseudanabaena sp. PCC 7367]AFY69634.1 Zeta toxin family protein [Pseudanabaena sp. PCC 7367]